jgi:Putative restriction endonuclease
MALDHAHHDLRRAPELRVTGARLAHWAIAASFATSTSGCGTDWVGSYGGQWNIGGGVIVAPKDGGEDTLYKNSAQSGVVSESEVTLSKQGGDQFLVELDTPFMACTLHAAPGADKELAFDGPTVTEAYQPDGATRWQHCTFTFEGFRGEANVRGTVRSKPGGVLTIVLQILPYSTPSVKIVEGSSAIANFEGSAGDRFIAEPARRLPGGWWFATEVEVELEKHEVYRPDVAGWRRERLPELPEQPVVTVRPAWVCEVSRPSNTRNDLVKKLRVHHRCEAPHYWIVDPTNQILTVHRWSADGCLRVLPAERGERLRAEPFDAVEWPVGILFGDEPDEDT